jgi:hypothetical protein
MPDDVAMAARGLAVRYGFLEMPSVKELSRKQQVAYARWMHIRAGMLRKQSGLYEGIPLDNEQFLLEEDPVLNGNSSPQVHSVLQVHSSCVAASGSAARHRNSEDPRRAGANPVPAPRDFPDMTVSTAGSGRDIAGALVEAT